MEFDSLYSYTQLPNNELRRALNVTHYYSELLQYDLTGQSKNGPSSS